MRSNVIFENIFGAIAFYKKQFRSAIFGLTFSTRLTYQFILLSGISRNKSHCKAHLTSNMYIQRDLSILKGYIRVRFSFYF